MGALDAKVGNGRWMGPTALVCQVSYALGSALCALYLVQLITGLTLVLCVYVPHGAVAYAYVHGQDMVYSRRLALPHRIGHLRGAQLSVLHRLLSAPQ